MRYQVLRLPHHYYWGAGLIGGVALVLPLLVLIVGLVVPWLVGDPSSGRPVAAAAPGHPALTQRRPIPPVPASSALMMHTTSPDRVVALTFDDGPSPEYTPQVLALLTRYRAVATFCMIGAEAARHPDLVRNVVAAGMRLCDHTVSHDEHLSQRPEPQIEAEIVGGRDALRDVAGPGGTVDYFRAPAGRWSDPVRAIAARNGMRPLSWSLDPRDWSRPGVARIVAAVQQQAQPGAVVLLHDGGGRRDQTVAALGELLPWFIAQGYRFDVP